MNTNMQRNTMEHRHRMQVRVWTAIVWSFIMVFPKAPFVRADDLQGNDPSQVGFNPNRVVFDDFVIQFSFSSDFDCQPADAETLRADFEDCLRVYAVGRCTFRPIYIGLGNAFCTDEDGVLIKGGVFTLEDAAPVSKEEVSSCVERAALSNMCKMTFMGSFPDLEDTTYALVTPAPTAAPTGIATISPTLSPTAAPTVLPTTSPSLAPTVGVSENPSASPSAMPSVTPSQSRSVAPSPSQIPDSTEFPAVNSTPSPTPEPSEFPTATSTASPTTEPTEFPTFTSTPSPTPEPTEFPTFTSTPSPTTEPTEFPTISPTSSPTPEVTEFPTVASTPDPTPEPTRFPTITSTPGPTPEPTRFPTATPTTGLQSVVPTIQPSAFPSAAASDNIVSGIRGTENADKSDNNSTVPMAVGTVAGGLLVLILAAVLLVRRRKEHSDGPIKQNVTALDISGDEQSDINAKNAGGLQACDSLNDTHLDNDDASWADGLVPIGAVSVATREVLDQENATATAPKVETAITNDNLSGGSFDDAVVVEPVIVPVPKSALADDLDSDKETEKDWTKPFAESLGKLIYPFCGGMYPLQCAGNKAGKYSVELSSHEGDLSTDYEHDRGAWDPDDASVASTDVVDSFQPARTSRGAEDTVEL